LSWYSYGPISTVSMLRVRNVRSTAFLAHSFTVHGPPGMVGLATRMAPSSSRSMTCATVAASSSVRSLVGFS
jgi:hypothetical protein